MTLYFEWKIFDPGGKKRGQETKITNFWKKCQKGEEYSWEFSMLFFVDSQEEIDLVEK